MTYTLQNIQRHISNTLARTTSGKRLPRSIMDYIEISAFITLAR